MPAVQLDRHDLDRDEEIASMYGAFSGPPCCTGPVATGETVPPSVSQVPDAAPGQRRHGAVGLRNFVHTLHAELGPENIYAGRW
jgi:hypothetical protein